MVHKVRLKPALICQRDDGRWSTGLHDEGPGFESRRFAEIRRRAHRTGVSMMTVDVTAIAMLLAEKTSLGALCTNMQIRAALEFLDGRGYCVSRPKITRPQPAGNARHNQGTRHERQHAYCYSFDH